VKVNAMFYILDHHTISFLHVIQYGTLCVRKRHSSDLMGYLMNKKSFIDVRCSLYVYLIQH